MNNAEANVAERAATVAEQGAHGAPNVGRMGKTTGRKKGGPKAKAAAKRGATAKPGRTGKKVTKSKPSTPRAQSKGAKILEMIGRTGGATLAEIMKATGWQAHSVRGFLSTAGKKHGVKIESTKSEAGDRVYCIIH